MVMTSCASSHMLIELSVASHSFEVKSWFRYLLEVISKLVYHLLVGKNSQSSHQVYQVSSSFLQVSSMIFRN